MRRKCRKIYYGNLAVGGNSPITVQSMTNTKTSDVKATVGQIEALTEVGCEIIRVAVPDMEAASKLSEIKSKIKIPIIVHNMVSSSFIILKSRIPDDKVLR